MNTNINIIPKQFFVISKRLNALIALLFLVVTNIAFSSTPQEIYTTANEAYQKGEYQQAIATYQSLLEEGNLSTDIYYNLGNCYYKDNQIAAAILYYEKALKMKPNNKDAAFNLAMANKKTIDKIEYIPETFIAKTWKSWITAKTATGWSYYCIILIFVSLVFFASYLLAHQVLIKKGAFYIGVFFFFFSLFSFIMAMQNNAMIQQSAAAIIFESTITIQSEPANESKKLFTLHEGTKVKLLETVNEWSKIQMPNGNVGWTLSKYIEKI